MIIREGIIGDLKGLKIIESNAPMKHKQAVIYNKVITMLRVVNIGSNIRL